MDEKHRPDIYIGLVGQLGVDLDDIYNHLSKSLRGVGYSSSIIRVSKTFLEIDGLKAKIVKSPEGERIRTSMDAGDEIRDKLGGAATAMLAMGQIQEERERVGGTHMRGHAYVIKSLKRSEEIRRFKNVYGGSFLTVSAYLPEEDRIRNLEEWKVDNPEELVKRDYHGSGTLGQDVRKAFPEGDVFIDAKDKAKEGIKRFIEIMFGYPWHTPRMEESGMFHAMASSMRSASLSRQVGAAILDKKGNLVSTGTNEVPKAHGGIYTEDYEYDNREFKKKVDSNDKQKSKMLENMFEQLKKDGLLSEDLMSREISDIMNSVKMKNVLEMEFMKLTEYGREVHAEMDALVAAARSHVSVERCIMYCTTFPCHICAKHIVASGIDTLVFIEPYPKSHAKELFADSINVGGEAPDERRILFKPYIGISPNQYMHVFKMNKRKDKDGNAIGWDFSNSKTWRWKWAEPLGEEASLSDLYRLMEEKGLAFKKSRNHSRPEARS